VRESWRRRVVLLVREEDKWERRERRQTPSWLVGERMGEGGKRWKNVLNGCET